ncbi:MAG: TIM barrel protein [Oscillospiraceae bacterium]|nr:TIM barrel protein [Oscillospiraceae bacterium]
MTEKRTSALFGSGGNPKSFYDEGHKETAGIFKWLKEKNIDSYEYQAGNGLNAGPASLKNAGEEAAANNILLSLHAPYYISIASGDDDIIARSISNIVRSIDSASAMGAYMLVIHSGSLGKYTRERALDRAKSTIYRVLNIIYRDNKTSVRVGLETMGKQNQLGTLDEVIELCRLDGILYPAVDFGHLNARGKSERFKTPGDYLRVFDKIGEKLTDEKAKYMHCHFSKIEYTQKGERKHLTFEDKIFGPEFEPLAKVLAENKLYPNIICESDGTMDIDASYMKETYFSFLRKKEK